MISEDFKNVKILYVEDEDFIRENAVEYLSRYFSFVYEARDGLEALEKIENIKPDIVITDIKMPKLNGLEMTKKIRQKDKKTQIIIATAHTNTEYLIEAVELQLVKYMVKPILESKLMPILKQCVQNIKDETSNIKKLSEDAIFDMFNKSLVVDKKLIKLTKNERMFLELMCKNTNRTVTYEEIENYIWYDSFMSGDAIRSLVKSIRKKLPFNCIENLSGIGYKINLINY
jgi:DNA-binding response OmpR family regulator